MAASMWFYFQRVLIPHQIADAAANDHPRGNLSDLYPRWWGAHELLLHGRDPYSEEVTREIQQGYYGRVLNPERAGDPKDQQGFVYPAYVVFLLAPTLHWRFPTVQRAFLALLWVLTAATVPLWLRALRWRVSLAMVATLVVLTLGSLPAVQGLKLQQLSLLVAGLLAMCAAAVAAGYFALAGILLALATIKPQLVWLLALWLLAWALCEWRRRQALVWAFGATMLLLAGGAELVLPGWISQFRAAVGNYQAYTHLSILGLLFTRLGGEVAAFVLILFAAWLGWPLLAENEDSPQFRLMLALVLALTTVVIPMFAPYNQLLLLPAILLALRRRKELWQGNRSLRLILVVSALLLFWPWIATVGLTVCALAAPHTNLPGWRLPYLGSLLLPILLFALIALWGMDLRSKPRTTQSFSTSA